MEVLSPLWGERIRSTRVVYGSGDEQSGGASLPLNAAACLRRYDVGYRWSVSVPVSARHACVSFFTPASDKFVPSMVRSI